MASARDRTSREKPSVTHEWSFSSFSHSQGTTIRRTSLQPRSQVPILLVRRSEREKGRRVEVDPENKVGISLERTLKAHLGSVFMEVGDPRG